MVHLELEALLGLRRRFMMLTSDSIDALSHVEVSGKSFHDNHAIHIQMESSRADREGFGKA